MWALDRAVTSTGFDGLLWLFALAVMLHMIEELFWLPAWSQNAGGWHVPVGRREFAFATAVLLLFVALITYMAARTGSQSVPVYLVCGLALVMLVNFFLPHLGTTVAQRRYAPGLGTSLIFILPATSLLLWRAFEENMISLPRYLVAAAGMLLAAALVWPALFRIGRRFSGG